jgi:probable F420-dependent oxidoreductase
VLKDAWQDRRMRFGLHALGIGAGAQRPVVDAVAAAAEAVGFSTLWAGEHVLMVDESASRYPYAANGQIAVSSTADWLDPMICLSFAAAATSTITIATGVLLLPEHNPVVVAKKAATLDVLSGGRLILGVGVGWSAEEFDALGVPFARRAARTREYVAAMRTIWREDVASFEGEFVRFDSIRVNPKPLGRRAIPLVLGGNSDTALRRVAAWGDGWYGFNLDGTADVAERVDYLTGRCREAGRDPSDLRLAVSLKSPEPQDVAVLADLGIDELVIVEGPPAERDLATEWVRGLADRWLRR